jgi:hypothetical protein
VEGVLLLHLFTERVIKLTVVVIKIYHHYQLNTKFQTTLTFVQHVFHSEWFETSLRKQGGIEIEWDTPASGLCSDFKSLSGVGSGDGGEKYCKGKWRSFISCFLCGWPKSK